MHIKLKLARCVILSHNIYNYHNTSILILNYSQNQQDTNSIAVDVPILIIIITKIYM